jgi:hypothetical protein
MLTLNSERGRASLVASDACRDHVNRDAHRRAESGKFHFQSGHLWIEIRAPCAFLSTYRYLRFWHVSCLRVMAFEAEARRSAMKDSNRHTPAIAAIGTWCLSNVIVPGRAIHYTLGAVRDERNGFSYTAAMEWRQAAGLFAPGTRAAEYFWRQWERIMHLPRRLAGPIGISCQTAPVSPVAPASLLCNRPTIDQASFANAA